MPDKLVRYHGVSIGLHWLIAILIIGMLAVGKYMGSLNENDPLRFVLTQWHKSFGIALPLLIVVRIIWRVSNAPPALPEHMKRWELKAASITHLLLYALMLIVPLTGWIMVSASPLNLPTLLFKTFHWPHLPVVSSMDNKEFIAGLFHRVHDIAASIMIVLLLAHVGAALRHQFMLRDGVMSRMSPTVQGQWVNGVGRFTAAVSLIVAGLFALGYSMGSSMPLSAGDSDVSFEFAMMGSESQGVFPESTVTLVYDESNPEEGSLSAMVSTASATTGDMQVDSSLTDPDWFDSTSFPTATFTSIAITATDPDNLLVNGKLEIKGIVRDIEFPLTIASSPEGKTASGGFTINRLDFDIGKTAQPDDSTVGYNVIIQFSFELNQATPG